MASHDGLRMAIEQTEENLRRFSACPRHQFIQDGIKFVCTNCGGRANSFEVWLYEQGYKHGAAIQAS